VSIVGIARAVVAWAALWAGGCGVSHPPEFRLNREGRDPEEITRVQRDALTETLAELFGTPDRPAIPEGVGLDLDLIETAAGPEGRPRDARGGSGPERGLYRKYCAACHGISGDGAGPLAMILDPYPLDFRRGVFKYTSTLAGAKPTGDDLERTLASGMCGTGMPSFARLVPRARAALREYVKYLSIRGETERYLIQLVVDEDEYLPLGVDAREMVLEDGAVAAAESWALPEESPEEYVVVPPPMPSAGTPEQLAASIALGRAFYGDKDSQCVTCHGPEGAGDGEQTDLYDDWNKPKQGVTPEETRRLARLYTLPIQRLRARNFHQGAFHGGDRPEDLYWRIHVGIKGTPMPTTGPMPGAAGALAPEEIWHVVDYVRSLAGMGRDEG